jgi:hypothetical protein
LYLHEELLTLSERLILAAHTSLVQDYDLQMQRVQAVAPQSKALAKQVVGREVVRWFAPHSSVVADRMKVEKDPKLTVANLAEALKKQKGQPNERKRQGNDPWHKNGFQSRAGKQKSGKAAELAETQTPVPASKPSKEQDTSATSGNKAWAKGKG